MKMYIFAWFRCALDRSTQFQYVWTLHFWSWRISYTHYFKGIFFVREPSMFFTKIFQLTLKYAVKLNAKQWLNLHIERFFLHSIHRMQRFKCMQRVPQNIHQMNMKQVWLAAKKWNGYISVWFSMLRNVDVIRFFFVTIPVGKTIMERK